MTGVFALSAIPSGIAIKNKFSAFPPDVVAAGFFALYPNRVQAILCPRGCRSWTTISKHWPMSNETILSAVAGNEPSIYGLRWGEQTRFAVLDIDKNSKYRSDLELAKLQERLAAVGLTVTVYRSSNSGGWHLYIFLDDWADSREVNEYLNTWLRARDYEVRGGLLEVFPSGMGLRLPLQPGFAWLDEKGNLILTREELTRDEALASFLTDLEENKKNWTEAKNSIRTELEAIDRAKGGSVQARKERLDTEGFEKLFSYRLIPEKYQDGRRYWQTGLTACGQRHDAILGIEHYLWHGDPSADVPALPGEWNDEQRYRLILAWLQENHNGFCNHINRGNWRKVEAQIRRAVKWRRPSGGVQVRTPYLLTERSIERLIGRSKATGRTWTPEDFKKGNDGREAQAREKIREATQLLTGLGQRLTVKGLALASGCSRTTVRRHLDIWKISPVAALSKCTGDQNPFLDLDLLGGAGTVPCGPSGSEEKSFLPVLVDAVSGDLELDLVENAEIAALVLDDLNPDPVLELVGPGSEGSGACSPVLLGRWRRRGKATGWRHWGSLASPSHTQPSTGSKHWLWGSESTCGLNGFLPSCAEPPLGPLHLNPREIFSPGSGLVLLQDDGGIEAGSGGNAIIASQAGQVSETGPCPPVDLFSLSGVIGLQTDVSGLLRYQSAGSDSACLQFWVSVFGFSRHGVMRDRRRDIHVNSPQDKPLRILVYSDVRGPPSVNSALIATPACWAPNKVQPIRKCAMPINATGWHVYRLTRHGIAVM